MERHHHLVLLSVVLGNALTAGYTFGFPRILPALLETRAWSRSEAGAVHSTLSAVFCCTGVVSGMLVRRFGPKRVAAVGTLMAGIPICLSFLSTSLVVLVVCQGIVSAIGISFTYISVAAVVTECYSGHTRALALTLSVTGAGLGGMVYSYLIDFLLFTFGLSGCFLICGGFLLNAFPLVLLWPAQRRTSDMSVQKTECDDPVQNQTKTITVTSANLCQRMKNTITPVIADKVFILFGLGIVLSFVTDALLMVYLVDIIMDKHGSPGDGTFAVLLFSVLSVSGRIVPGLLKQIPHLPLLLIPLAAVIVSTIAKLVIVFENSVTVAFIAIACTGLTFGIISSCLSVTTAALLDVKRTPIGMGLIFTTTGIGVVVAGPLYGYIRDITGSYMVTMVCSSAILAWAVASQLAAFGLRRRARTVLPTRQLR